MTQDEIIKMTCKKHMPEQKLTWEQIPKPLQDLVYNLYSKETHVVQCLIANGIMEAMKPELKRAMISGFNKGCCAGHWPEEDPNFETWYQNTYLK